MESVFNLCMLIGGPVVGRICDVYGANIGIVCTLVGAALSYLLMALAWSFL